MGELLANVLPLALGAAISPTLLGAQLLALSAASEPLRRSWALAAGAAAVLVAYTALGLAAGFGTDSAADHPSEVGAVLKLAIAALLLGLGIRNALRAPKPKGRGDAPREPRLSHAFILGAVLMLTNVTTLALYFPAMHDIGIADVETAGKVAAVLLVYAVTMSLVIAPPLVTAALGERGSRAVGRLGDFMSRHQHAIATVVPLAFAVILAVEAVPDL